MDSLSGFIQKLFADREMLRMGHLQRTDDANLGLGWLYYAMGRIIRPEFAVVIGSYRGFTPRVIARPWQTTLSREKFGSLILLWRMTSGQMQRKSIVILKIPAPTTSGISDALPKNSC